MNKDLQQCRVHDGYKRYSSCSGVFRGPLSLPLYGGEKIVLIFNAEKKIHAKI